MNLPFFIARKYFFSGKKRNFINVISIISMAIVAICTAALIVVLSVFNGLEGLLRSMYNTFDPELKIEATRGKTFEVSDEFLNQIKAIEGIDVVTEVIEDYAYVRYREANMVVTIKGVSENFIDQHRIDNSIIAGDLKLKEGLVNYAIIGQGVQYTLSIVPGNDLYPLQVHYTKDVKPGQLDISKLYSKKNILVGSVFAIEKNYDENYIFVPLSFAQELLDYDKKRTSLEIKCADGANIQKTQQQLKELLGDGFKVLNNDEQHADLFKLLNLEKLFVFIAFSFILLVGSINIFFSLSMLAIDKKKDISILYSMGATNKLIRKIFLFEGAIISLGGAFIGLILGGFICWLQQNFGLVSMGMETSLLENYPVQLQPLDFVYTFVSLVMITLLISYRPAIIATRYSAVNQL
ncbi:ABC transporter permease [Fulvivirga lutea]|uniref:ABC transporter permease n=1 Tax=Fulvivirga lutea TaxID=2810512 RepID=A0A975A1Q3_9BACT|nr:FtsX-like permease family protein [Fulvivirga lutea]QSE98571.1 ABC transporter permease [Fulvivirga lutea]